MRFPFEKTFLVAGLFFAGHLAAVADSVNRTKLFTLERTTNANQVVYELRTSPERTLHKPIHAYWLMLADDGHREELTSYENDHIYGVQILQHDPAITRFIIKALPTYPITIQTHPLLPTMASIHLLNKDCFLKDVYLNVSGGLFPSVRTIAITCSFQPTSRPTHWLLIPDDNGGWKVQRG